MRIAVWIFAAVMIASIAQADSPPTSQPAATNPTLWARLVKIDQIGAKANDLTADFEQQKFTPLLRKPLISTGTIRVKGTAMVWDTAKPEPTAMRIDQKEIQLYYPRQKVLEIYPIDRQLGSLAASPLPRLDVLRKYFAIEEIPATDAGAEKGASSDRMGLRLTPTDALLREHLDQVVVLLDVQRGLILRAEMTDADGDRTQIVFSNIQVNTGLKDGDVTLHVPESAQVTRPLDGLGSSPPPQGK